MDIKIQNSSPAELTVWANDLTGLIKNIKFRQVIIDAKDKKLLLFIGITGSGKSTCISYLLGANLEKVRALGGKKCAALSSEQVLNRKYPEIGAKNYKSCTLYSEVFDDAASELAFCDTAGFLDTRSEEEQVCASLSIQLAVQSAKEIKALVVVLEWGIFDPKTTTDLKALMSTLSQVLKGPYEGIAGSIIFLINKVPEDVNKNDLIYLVSEYKSELDKNIAQITSKMYNKNLDLEQIEQLNRTALFIDLFKNQLEKRPENIVLINVFDKGECRDYVCRLLKDIDGSISKEQFNFKSFDKKRIRFNAEVDGLVKKGSVLVDQYFDLVARKEEIEKSKAHVQASKDYYAAFNSFLKANDHAVFDSMKKRFIELTKKEIDRLNNERQICGQKIIALKEKNVELLAERDSLNKGDSDLVYEDQHYEPVAPTLSDIAWSKIFFRSEKRFIYPFKVPFIFYETSGNGSFSVVINNPNQGLCEVIYTSCFGEDGNASFKIYAEKRLVPKNADRIFQIDIQIPKNENRIETYVRKLKSTEIEAEEINALLTTTENTRFDENNLQKQETERKFLECFKSNEVIDIKKQKEHIYQELSIVVAKITGVNQEIEKLKDAFMLIEILSDLFLRSHAVNSFLKSYGEYKNRFEEERRFALVNAEVCLKEIAEFDVLVIFMAETREKLDFIKERLEAIQRSIPENTFYFEVTKAMLCFCKSFQKSVIVWAKLRDSFSQLLEISFFYPEKSDAINRILKTVLFHVMHKYPFDEKVLRDLLMVYIKHFGHDARDSQGNTFLHAAVQVNNLPLVSSLLKAEMSVMTQNIQGQTPFLLAVKNKQYSLAIVILQHCPLNLQKKTDLLIDVQGNNIYQYLLDGILTDAKTVLDQILIISQLLANYGAKYPVETALKTQTANPFLVLVKTLRLAFTMVINSLDDTIWEYKLLITLLKNLNTQERQSCLLIGIQGERLLDLLLANHNQSPHIVEKTLEIFVPSDSVMHRDVMLACILAKNHEISAFLLTRWKPPVDINFLPADKMTLLGLAIIKRQDRLVDLLLKYKADINQLVVYNPVRVNEEHQIFSGVLINSIQSYLHLSEEFVINKVHANGGGFFETFAQIINSLVGARLYSEKNLRELCYRYYQKNPEKVEGLRIADSSMITTDYEAIRYYGESSSCDILPGKPRLDGVILCRIFDLKAIYIARIASESDGDLVFEYYVITQDGLSIVKKREMPDGIPLIIMSNDDNHFIPVVRQYLVSPLRLCILENDVTSLNLLFNSKQKFNLRETNCYGHTLFHTAALIGNMTVLKILENRLTNTERFEWLCDKDHSGNTPLSLSIKYDNTQCTEWFFEIIDKYSQIHPEKINYRGRVLRAADVNGQTALMVAVKNRNAAAVQACLRHNTNSFWSNHEGDQAFQMALSDKQMPENIVEHIRQSKIAHCMDLVKAHIQTLLSHDKFHSIFISNWMIQLEKVFNESSYKYYHDKIMRASMSSLQTIAEHLAIGIAHAIREKYHSEDHKILLQTNIQHSSYHAWDQVLRQAIDRMLLTLTEQLQIQKKYSEQSSHQITYYSDAKNDKHRAFTRALKEALRNYFYVSRALYEGKVLMNDEGFNAFKAAFNIASPFATEIASSLTTLNIGVIGSFVSAALELVTRLKDAQYQCEAGRFVQAFGLCQPDAIEKYEKDISIDHDKLKAVAESLYRRYRDQIQQCTLSKEADVSIRLSKTDGIYVLANVIADRIFQHMIKKGSIKIDDERTIKEQMADWWTTLGAEKDIYFELSLMSLPERCIMAVLHEYVGDDRDMHIRTDRWLRNGCNTDDIWMAGGILVKTGLKLERNPSELYVRKGGVTQESLHAKYGYCYVSENMLNLKEIEKRGFVKASLSQTDMFANQLSEVEQKNVAPCFIL